MRKYIFSLLLIISLLPMSAMATDSDGKKVDTRNITVYVTNTGDHYHMDGCSYLKSRNTTNLYDATVAGYSPCSRCDPPVLENVKPKTPEPDKPATTTPKPTSSSSYSVSSTQPLDKTTIQRNAAVAAIKAEKEDLAISQDEEENHPIGTIGVFIAFFISYLYIKFTFFREEDVEETNARAALEAKFIEEQRLSDISYCQGKIKWRAMTAVDNDSSSTEARQACNELWQLLNKTPDLARIIKTNNLSFDEFIKIIAAFESNGYKKWVKGYYIPIAVFCFTDTLNLLAYYKNLLLNAVEPKMFALIVQTFISRINN